MTLSSIGNAHIKKFSKDYIFSTQIPINEASLICKKKAYTKYIRNVSLIYEMHIYKNSHFWMKTRVHRKRIIIIIIII